LGEIWAQGELGGPGDQGVAGAVGPVRKRLIGAQHTPLARFGAVDSQRSPARLRPQVHPGQQLGQFGARPLDQRFRCRTDAVLGQGAAQVPDLLAWSGRVAGDGQPRRGLAAQAVAVQGMGVAVADEYLLQRPALHDGGVGAQCCEQGFVAGPGGADEGGRSEAQAPGGGVQLQHQFSRTIALPGRGGAGKGKDRVPPGRGQGGDQTGYIQHQIHQAVQRTLKSRLAKQRRALLHRHRCDAAPQRSAGEKGGDAAAGGGAGPQIEVLAQHPRPAQVQVAGAVQAAAPVLGHGGNGFGCAGERPGQTVLDATVDHALAGNGLAAAERVGFEQQNAVAAATQVVEQPQAGDAAAEDGDIEAHGVGRSHEACGRREGPAV